MKQPKKDFHNLNMEYIFMQTHKIICSFQLENYRQSYFLTNVVFEIIRAEIIQK